MKKISIFVLLILWAASLSLAGCKAQAGTQSGVKVVATTTIVGDVVRQVGGDRISLTVLYPVGADPHTYEPRPQDVAAISDAQVVFINGLELEHSLDPILTANANGTVKAVSDGVEVLPFSAAAGDSQHAAGDPHTWMDPNNVLVWVENIRQELTKIDTQGSTLYQANADAYLQKLKVLDQWISGEISQIPQDQRRLVTDHESLGYFVRRYGLEQTGLVLPSLSTSASASAQDLAKLEEVIKAQKVKAIFIEMGINDALARQVATDTGIKVIFIYTGSLGTSDNGAGDYIGFMHYNVNAIVDGLR